MSSTKDEAPCPAEERDMVESVNCYTCGNEINSIDEGFFEVAGGAYIPFGRVVMVHSPASPDTVTHRFGKLKMHPYDCRQYKHDYLTREEAIDEYKESGILTTVLDDESAIAVTWTGDPASLIVGYNEEGFWTNIVNARTGTIDGRPPHWMRMVGNLVRFEDDPTTIIPDFRYENWDVFKEQMEAFGIPFWEDNDGG